MRATVPHPLHHHRDHCLLLPLLASSSVGNGHHLSHLLSTLNVKMFLLVFIIFRIIWKFENPGLGKKCIVMVKAACQDFEVLG